MCVFSFLYYCFMQHIEPTGISSAPAHIENLKEFISTKFIGDYSNFSSFWFFFAVVIEAIDFFSVPSYSPFVDMQTKVCSIFFIKSICFHFVQTLYDINL